MTNTVNKRLTNTVLWTGGSITIAIILVLFLSTIDNADGTPWLESSTVAQTLVTLGVVTAALVPALISTRKDTAEVREQVQNSHSIGMRDDLDQKYGSHDVKQDAALAGLKHLTTLVEGLIEDQRESRKDIATVRTKVEGNSKKIATMQKILGTATDEIHVVADTLGPITKEHP